MKKLKFFFIDPKKTKVIQKTYIDFLTSSLLPECRRLYPDNDFVFLLDSAPSHCAKATPNFLRDNTPNFRDKWRDVDDQTVRKAILQWKRRLAAVAKQN